MLKNFVLSSGDELFWAKCLSFCEFVLNPNNLSSTGKNPFELICGKKVILLLDHLIGATLYLYIQADREITELVDCLVADLR